MPTIEISTTSFSRLQAYATPLVDSVETALIKVLDMADSASKAGANVPVTAPSKPQGTPDLSFTTLKSASINGRVLLPGQRNWNAFMLEVVKEAAKHLPAGVTIADQIVVNHVRGKKGDQGYKYLPTLDVSIQGQNANNAWKAISHLTKLTGLKAEASFYWSNDPKAEKPGEHGRLVA